MRSQFLYTLAVQVFVVVGVVCVGVGENQPPPPPPPPPGVTGTTAEIAGPIGSVIEAFAKESSSHNDPS